METEVNGGLWRILEALPVNEWLKLLKTIRVKLELQDRGIVCF